jgi:cathepsin L
MKLLLALALFVSAASAVSFFDVVVEEWQTWKVAHGKEYPNETEEKFRMKIYMENKAMVEKHNHKAHKGQHSYFLKMNHFGDLLHHEFVANMNGFRMDLKNTTLKQGLLGATFIEPAGYELPAKVDWRDKGAVTPVKNQGACGSCWAFSTTGSLEGQHFRKTGKLVSLSEQNLVDCSVKFGNHGCNGGLMDFAFAYIKANGGLDTEDSYPYEGHDDSCHFTKSNVGANDKGYVDVKIGSEADLMKAIASVGPVSVAIDASHKSFQFYSAGIYNEPECDSGSLDHGVLAVGYGDGYFLVKNSWDTVWGDQGYIKMTRDGSNQCGIASSASYPLV